MSNLVPDPGDRSDSQITPGEKRDRVDLYFQDLIAQEQISLSSTTEVDERKKKLELIQIALNLEGQMVDLKEKKIEADRKDANFQLQLAQDKVKLDLARIDLIDRQTKSTDLKLRTNIRLLSIPIFLNLTDIKMDTPSNYFDVLKTIEVVPDSLDPNQPGIKDVLIQLQSYVESDSTLVVSEKEAIFELIKRMAIEAKSDPINNDLKSIVESIQQIDRNSDFKARIVQALKAGSIQVLEEQFSHPAIKIAKAAIKGWIEETKKLD